jgi:fucose 4-O-acetylase-like acetyltransferase
MSDATEDLVPSLVVPHFVDAALLSLHIVLDSSSFLDELHEVLVWDYSCELLVLCFHISIIRSVRGQGNIRSFLDQLFAVIKNLPSIVIITANLLPDLVIDDSLPVMAFVNPFADL